MRRAFLTPARLEARDVAAAGQTLYRFAFFAAVAMHFVPTFLSCEENYGSGRFPIWSQIGFGPIATQVACVVATLSMFLGAVGYQLRLAAAGTLLSLGYLHGINDTNTATLALPAVWVTLLVLTATGRLGSPLRWGLPTKDPSYSDSIARPMLLFFLLQSIWFSGLHKIQADWFSGVPMARILNLPVGVIVRPLSSLVDEGLSPEAVQWLGRMVVVTELVAPLLLLSNRTYGYGLLWLFAFFLSLGCILIVPPLFLVCYAGIVLLGIRPRDCARQAEIDA
jgi:hypothetical protein